ncbi:MAG TPA: UbiA-like protein EboC [Vicinamibacterales bacterium]|nr:UbiA-like protein EboC [Vicinamibacterales bacterium]
MTIRAWLELLRPPNVVTALADVLAGFSIAGLQDAAELPWLLVATACLYGGGVVLNDVFDRHLDAVERPERPLPSGRVRVSTAAALGAGLLTGGVLSASAAGRSPAQIAAAIAVLVVVYDAWGKHQAAIGPVNMGLCRALNLLLGVSAVPAALATAWPLAAIPLVYIGAVTGLSRGEVHGGGRRAAGMALISLCIALLALTSVTLAVSGGSLAGLALVVVLGWRVVPPFWTAYREPSAGAVRHAVRTGVLSLVLVNAAIGATFGGLPFGLLILATGGAAWALARLFAVT